jgi:hypothetical protein
VEKGQAWERGGADGLFEVGQLISNMGPDWSEVRVMQNDGHNPK